jgi:hypothetical protein
MSRNQVKRLLSPGIQFLETIFRQSERNGKSPAVDALAESVSVV